MNMPLHQTAAKPLDPQDASTQPQGRPRHRPVVVNEQGQLQVGRRFNVPLFDPQQKPISEYIGRLFSKMPEDPEERRAFLRQNPFEVSVNNVRLSVLELRLENIRDAKLISIIEKAAGGVPIAEIQKTLPTIFFKNVGPSTAGQPGALQMANSVGDTPTPAGNTLPLQVVAVPSLPAGATAEDRKKALDDCYKEAINKTYGDDFNPAKDPNDEAAKLKNFQNLHVSSQLRKKQDEDAHLQVDAEHLASIIKRKATGSSEVA